MQKIKWLHYFPLSGLLQPTYILHAKSKLNTQCKYHYHRNKLKNKNTEKLKSTYDYTGFHPWHFMDLHKFFIRSHIFSKTNSPRIIKTKKAKENIRIGKN